MTELAAPQISSLMEALPGIAAVLRSPVANAIVALSRAGAGLEEFRPVEAEELLRYGVRRNLLTQDEVDRILAEIREVFPHRPAKSGAQAAEKPKKPVISPPPVSPHKAAVPLQVKGSTAAAPAKASPAKASSARASSTKAPAKRPAKAKAAPKPAAKKSARSSGVKTVGKKAPAKAAPKKSAIKKHR